MKKSINPIKMHDGVLLRLVPHEPDNGYRLYVSDDGTIGLRIAPNGVETVMEGKYTTTENSANPTNAKRKQRYLKFYHPWNTEEGILVSHAVYLAWVGPFDEPCIDHLDGITTNNHWSNLDPVTYAENSRRTKYLRVLRDCGFDPRIFTVSHLREFFAQPFEEFKTAMYHHKDV